jgi:diguanylate cyclase (GGDEF)-like protein
MEVPKGKIQNYKIEDLFDLDELQALQEQVASVLHVASVITRPDGTPLTKKSNFTPFCSELVRKSEKGRENCEYSDCLMGKPNKDGPTIAVCRSGGLMDAGVSIMMGEHHLANWIIGQVLDPCTQYDEENYREKARQLGIEPDRFIEEIRKVPKMSMEQFERSAWMVYILANKMSALAAQIAQSKDLLEQYEHLNKELIAEREELLYVSSHDVLTGLCNRRYFDEMLETLDDEKYLPLTIISADANNLKLTNDILGHLCGDDLLRTVGRIMQNCAEERYIVCRCGGDEFNAILPNTDIEEARVYINQVLEECGRNKIGFLPVSIAIGCDVRKNCRMSMNTVFKNAEERMYRHKRKIKAQFNIVWFAETQVKARGYVSDEMYERVYETIRQFSGRLGYDDGHTDQLKAEAALMYLGTICIPEEIFFKKEPLTAEERTIVDKYPLVGYQILKLRDDMQFAAPVIRQIQERYDGKGYPQGLSGDEIHKDARVLSIVKAYISMSSDHTYRRAMQKEEIIRELETNSGTQFDPQMTKVFIELLKQDIL